MKLTNKIILIVLALAIIFLVGCTPETQPTEPETPPITNTDANPTPKPDFEKEYNVIFALATVPPVLSALDCISNGNETYAIIERGKTYNGIDNLDYFHNAGFNTTNNTSAGFTVDEFNAMVNKVKELKDDDVFFNFYVQDGTALFGAAIAANAGVSERAFHVYMCEDGTGAYTNFRSAYLDAKNVTADTDEIYDNYVNAVKNARNDFVQVMSKKDNRHNDGVLGYNIPKAYALASLPNFTYYLQDESIIINSLEKAGGGQYKTKLLSCFGVEGYDAQVEYTLNLKYQKIADGVKKLTEEQRMDYLTLMYGDYYADTYDALTRTMVEGKEVPNKKLVFIGARHGSYPKFASSYSHGIGGLSTSDSVAKDYASLQAKYKTPLLFASEADYNVFLEIIADDTNYFNGISAELRNAAEIACFNMYIDYIFTLKLTYSSCGQVYDIIMKGHPREALGSYKEWNGTYRANATVAGENQSVVIDNLVDKMFLNFHAKDTVGKYIGMVPYGTAAENLAYLGADIAIGGLPSSTYSGYDPDVDVLFIIGETNQSITGNFSQVKERFEDGTLVYTNDQGEKEPTIFLNIGNVYQLLAELYAGTYDLPELAGQYELLFENWVKQNVTLDLQGFPQLK